MSTNETRADYVADLVRDRIIAKQNRLTLGGVLENQNDRQLTVFRGNNIVYVGTCRTALDTLSPTMLCQKIKKYVDMKGRYVYL